MKQHYDIVIIGSGLGGLVSANILAREGYSVCVLEKNNQYGGNLQTFTRDKTIFDTGVHYIGGLSEGQNLHRYFRYLGITDELSLKKLDENGFDVITFDNDDKEYHYAQGYENFIDTLSAQFPKEQTAIKAYCSRLRETCAQFPLYELKHGKPYYDNTEVFRTGAKTYIDSLTKNKKLRAVLAGTNFLYAGDAERTPFYVHALSVNSYIESAYRCVNGGSQISRILIRKLKQYGGETYKYHEVTGFDVGENRITGVRTKNGKQIKGNTFISNIEPKLTIDLIGEDKFRKSYVSRIKNIENTVSAFSLYIVLNPGTFKYLNRNYYHFRDHTKVWDAQNYTEESWPEGYMVSMGVKKDTRTWGDSLTAMTYMRYEEVKHWENTFNTVASKNDRGQTYEEFKARKTECFLRELEKKFPGLRECIHAVYASTPLSYRDYIGCHQGSMYGYVKDVNNHMRSFVSPRTKIKNLFFTGQSINMHGILGVTIGAVITCSEILGKDYLLNQIIETSKQEEVS
ncbi:NAD(P)/FAD-dependent oxidoreductase [Sinomicrobium kalidii]|uniref:phytoene desaturase family protein n=1 Tax=Sinomicrobium kalidii TaxID=2900738 RepID=UPI001E507890|nr:NAD(P)/FAD-dependent oxidoreductase [Sinomicrobium kalidii]UGU15778.1 NAD(P)/FAD-dependent oxidoreductase [Sinomicrobium kalidii]